MKKDKKYPISISEFSDLPNEVRQTVLGYLKVYSECPITYENGKYSYDINIQAEYADDYKFIGIAYQDDFYTDEERTQNYIEQFHSYPSWYTGTRDYKMLRELKDKSLA